MSNYLAIVGAAIAAWIAGGIWYAVLAKPWMAALGWTQADMVDSSGKRRMPAGPMILSFVAELVMAFLLRGMIGPLNGPYKALHAQLGAGVGALAWLGFVVTTIAVNNGFQRRKPMLTIIDSGHWLLVLLIEGAILGATA